LEKSRENAQNVQVGVASITKVWAECLSLSLCVCVSHPALPTTTTTVLLGKTGRNIMRWKAAALACSPL
jgi:hypothetical protein